MKLNQYEWDPEKDKLGEGAFAEVFRAKDTYANRNVALKIYKIAVTSGDMGSTRQSKYSLEKEFNNLEGLSHTNIITYFGLNYIKHTDAMGRSGSYPVIIMEYANQGTLKEFVKTKPSKEVLNKLIRDIVLGVGYLHEEGLLHRDLKPGNILITKNKKGVPTAKISDFGISKDTLSAENITKSFTEMIGTPHYMAPEQFHKKKFGLDGTISSRTDLWAIGVIVYKSLTGKYPFGEGMDDIELVRDAITEKDPDLNSVPEDYKKLLSICFEKKAINRPSSAEELLQYINSDYKVYTKKKKDIESTIVEEEKPQNEDIDNTVFITKEGEEKPKSDQDHKVTKLQKTMLWIYAGISILWSAYLILDSENTVYAFLLYPISVFLFAVFYVKPKNQYTLPKLLNTGFLFYCNLIVASVVIAMSVNSSLKAEDYVFLFLGIIQGLVFSWLVYRDIKNTSQKPERRFAIENYLALFFLLTYCISYFFDIYKDTIGFMVVLLLDKQWMVLTLMPNVLFIAALFFFIYKKHKDFGNILILFFIASVGIASLWWLFLETNSLFFQGGKGFYSSLIAKVSSKVYIQDFKIGYYMWYFSMFFGFMVIIYSAIKETSFKKYFWPAISIFTLVLVIMFYNQWSKSKIGYDFNEGIENVDYSQFEEAMGNNAKWHFEKGVVSRMLEKYDEDNSDELKRMLRLFVDHSGLTTRIDDKQLKAAVETNDAEVLEILLTPKVGGFTEDVDFIEDEKSLLQMARDQQNTKMDTLLINKGAKLTDKEQKAEDLKRQEEQKAKEFKYHENFTNGSTKFPKFSDTNKEWTYEFSAYKINVKNKELSHKKTAYFDIDAAKPYSVSTKTIRGSSKAAIGLVFDYNGSDDYHIAEVGNNTVNIHKYEGGKWNKIKGVNVTTKEGTNTIMIRKNGNYVSCYLNGKIVISSQPIQSTGGKYMGMIVSNPSSNPVLYFDDFKVEGTKR